MVERQRSELVGRPWFTAGLVVVVAVVSSLVTAWYVRSASSSGRDDTAGLVVPFSVEYGTFGVRSVVRCDVGSSQAREVVVDTGGVVEEVLAGETVAEGDVVAVVEGRPVFAVVGVLPVLGDLGQGSSGRDVMMVEEALVRLGFDPGEVDGVFDLDTEAAMGALFEGAGFDQPYVPESAVLGAELAGRELTVLKRGLRGVSGTVLLQRRLEVALAEEKLAGLVRAAHPVYPASTFGVFPSLPVSVREVRGFGSSSLTLMVTELGRAGTAVCDVPDMFTTNELSEAEFGLENVSDPVGFVEVDDEGLVVVSDGLFGVSGNVALTVTFEDGVEYAIVPASAVHTDARGDSSVVVLGDDGRVATPVRVVWSSEGFIALDPAAVPVGTVVDLNP